MADYQIQESTRRCAASGRELRPGEKYFSVLFDEGGKFVRKDYACENWLGPPDGAFSFWQGKVPAKDEKRRPPIDDELLLDCLRRLEGEEEPGRVNFRYVVALLLMRRKRLKFEEAKTLEGREVLLLRDTRSRTSYQVVHPKLSEDEMAAVQDEVFQVLGWQ
jgi:hypothetical protein